MTYDRIEIRKIAHFIPVPMSFVEPTAEEREQWRLADERRQAEAHRRLSRYFTHGRNSAYDRPWFGIGPVWASGTNVGRMNRFVGVSVAIGSHSFAIHRGQ